MAKILHNPDDGFGRLLAELDRRLRTQESPKPLEAWRAVGAAGQPAFTNSWVNYGSGEAPVAFYRDSDGHVRLRGGLHNGSSATAAMFTLPTSYRPPFTVYFRAVGNSIAAPTVYVGSITSAGVVSVFSGSTTWMSLDGVTFRNA